MNALQRPLRLSFIIPGDSNSLSHNRRLHHMAKYQLVQQWRRNTRLVAEYYTRTMDTPIPWKVRVSFVVRRNRMLDPDNAAASAALKAICDGLVDAGVLEDDSARYVEFGGVRQEKSVQPEVEVILEEIRG